MEGVVMGKSKVYFAHPMELDGSGLLDESGKRAVEARGLLGEKFEVWVPEEHQAQNRTEQKKIDLDALDSADLIIADLYHFGLDINGAMLLGLGTNREIGFAFGKNKHSKKKLPIILVVRQVKNFHCFDKEDTYENYGITKICSSLAEACEYIRKNYEG